MQQKILNNRYELERKIGEGGMARVYVGRDLRLNRSVAVKIPHNQYALDADFLDRFFHEAQSAASLQHPNIVDVYDVGQDGDIHYIVMEYVDGLDLKRVINRDAPLPISQALHIGAQVARGLHAAHQAGMVHRDVKPQNVIIGPDGSATITDFGVAKSARSTALTETGVVFGTADYISPEQAQGLTATPRSDIYSLGVTLYEMLTGRLPFVGDTALAVAMKHVTDTPTPPRQLNRQIPAQVEALILRTLAKDPSQRPQSAAELARLLSSLDQIAQQPTMVNPTVTPEVVIAPPPAPRPPPTPRPPPNGSGSTGRYPSPRPAGPTRQPRQDGLGCGVFVVGMLIVAGVLGLVYLFVSGALNGLLPGPGQPSRPSAIVGATATAPTEGPTPTPSPTPVPLALVPDLTNQSDSTAQNLLGQLGLIAVPQTANSDLPAGTVFEQAVPANTQIAVGSFVTYTVSLGPVQITLEDLRNVRADRAQEILLRLGLVVQVTQQANSQVTEGFVISQSPNPGVRLQSGDEVTLVVSIGDKVRFPDIIGQSRERAESILNTTAGLTLVFVDVQGPNSMGQELFDATAPNHVVSAQIEGGKGLNNGELIPNGSRIILGVRAP